MKLKERVLILDKADCRNIRSWIGFGCTPVEALRSEIHLARINFSDVMMLQALEESDFTFVSYLNHKLSQSKVTGEYAC